MHYAWLELLKPQSPLLVIHFFQQGHTYSNKDTLPNSATPCEPMGAIFIQTTTPFANYTTAPVPEHFNLSSYKCTSSDFVCVHAHVCVCCVSVCMCVCA